MSDKKMIIRNCPCYESEGTFYNCVNERIEGDCQDCTDCVMKQIVEKCKEDWEDMTVSKFQSELLNKLDIQEIE